MAIAAIAEQAKAADVQVRAEGNTEQRTALAAQVVAAEQRAAEWEAAARLAQLQAQITEQRAAKACASAIRSASARPVRGWESDGGEGLTVSCARMAARWSAP